MERAHSLVASAFSIFEKFGNVCLRMPGLLILELWFQLNWVNHHAQRHSASNSFQGKAVEEMHINFLSSKLAETVSRLSEQVLFPDFIKNRGLDESAIHVLGYSAVCFGVTLMILPCAKLISVYIHIVCLLLIASSHYLSAKYVVAEQETGQNIVLDEFSKLERHGFYILSQILLAVLISCLLRIRSAPSRAALTAYTSPVIARTCGWPIENLHVVHNFACSFTMLNLGFYILNLVPAILHNIRLAYVACATMRREIGFWSSGFRIVKRLMVAEQLCIFWFTLLIANYKLVTLRQPEGMNDWFSVLTVFGQSCATPISLLAFCVCVSYGSSLVMLACLTFLHGRQLDDRLQPLRHGSAEGIMVLMIAFQTGIMDLSVQRRALLLGVMIFILCSSLLQSVYNVVEPQLYRVAAIHTIPVQEHIKVLSISLVLFVLPGYLSYAVSRYFPVDFWLVVILSTCAMTSIQMIGSLAVYGLYLYDSRRNEPWEGLDDMIVYVKAISKFIEFAMACLVVGYGFYEATYDRWSINGTVVLLVHCYINVWTRVKAGYDCLKMRRQSSKLYQCFDKATSEQLKRHQDVCPICYQDMTQQARITPCHHLFHGACLRKWLNIGETCPICHMDLAPYLRTRKDRNNGDNEEPNVDLHPAEGNHHANVDSDNDSANFSFIESESSDVDDDVSDDVDSQSDNDDHFLPIPESSFFSSNMSGTSTCINTIPGIRSLSAMSPGRSPGGIRRTRSASARTGFGGISNTDFVAHSSRQYDALDTVFSQEPFDGLSD